MTAAADQGKTSSWPGREFNRQHALVTLGKTAQHHNFGHANLVRAPVRIIAFIPLEVKYIHRGIGCFHAFMHE